MIAAPERALGGEELAACVRELQYVIVAERMGAAQAGGDLDEWLDVAWGSGAWSDGMPDAPGVRPGAAWEARADAHADRQLAWERAHCEAVAAEYDVRRRWTDWPAALAALPTVSRVMGPAWQLAVRETLVAGLSDEDVAMAACVSESTIVRHRKAGLVAMVRWLAARG